VNESERAAGRPAALSRCGAAP